jgi:hypothetical protein
MPKPRKRKGTVSSRARATRSQQDRADSRRQLSMAAYRWRRGAGWGLVGLAIIVGVSHWLAHLGAWSFASPAVMDLVAGYPTAAIFGVGGIIVLSRA